MRSGSDYGARPGTVMIRPSWLVREPAIPIGIDDGAPAGDRLSMPQARTVLVSEAGDRLPMPQARTVLVSDPQPREQSNTYGQRQDTQECRELQSASPAAAPGERAGQAFAGHLIGDVPPPRIRRGAPCFCTSPSRCSSSSVTPCAVGNRSSGFLACSFATIASSHSGISGLVSRMGRGTSSMAKAEHAGVAPLAAGPVAGQGAHRIQDRSETEQVGAMIHSQAFCLLRRQQRAPAAAPDELHAGGRRSTARPDQSRSTRRAPW